MMLMSVVNAASSVISMYMLSKLGRHALAAGALISSSYGLIIMLAISILFSVGAMIGRQYGAQQRDEIGRVFREALFMASLMAIPLMFLVYHIEGILLLLGQPKIVSDTVSIYFHGLVWAFLPSLWNAAYSQFLVGVSRPRLTVINSVTTLLGSAILGYVLMTGQLGLPRLGVYGVALGASITAWVIFIALTLILLLHPTYKKYQLFQFSWREYRHPKYLKTLFRIGWPISVQSGAELSSFTAATYLVGLLGITSLAAQQIFVQCSMFAIMGSVGLGQATTVLVSQANGRADLQETRRQCLVSVLLGVFIMFSIAQVYWWAPEKLIGLFINLSDPKEKPVYMIASMLLLFGGLNQLIDTVRNIVTGALRGFNDTRVAMFSGILACWFVAIPVGAFFAFYLKFGAPGLRVGFFAGILVAVGILIPRFYKVSGAALEGEFPIKHTHDQA